MFKSKPKGRVAAVCGGYVPQVKENGHWIGISKSLEKFFGSESQYKYCVCEIKETAQIILKSYMELTYD